MKKKVFSVTLVAILVALISVNGSLAYFTDNDIKTNVFTMGKVDIDITEKADGDLDGDGTPDDNVKPGTPITDPADPTKITGYGYVDVLPGSVLHKEPIVSVLSDSSDCWLGAKVTFRTELEYPVATGATDPTYTTRIFGSLFKGGVFGYSVGAVDTTAEPAWPNYLKIVESVSNTPVAYAKVVDRTVDNNNDGTDDEFWTDIYVYFIQKHAKDTNETLFKSVNIPTSLETLAGLNVDVDIKSAAIQAEGFATIVEAWEQLHTMLGQNP